MKKIVVEGLKPMCGENSKEIRDTRKVIYFFDDLRLKWKSLQSYEF